MEGRGSHTDEDASVLLRATLCSGYTLMLEFGLPPTVSCFSFCLDDLICCFAIGAESVDTFFPRYLHSGKLNQRFDPPHRDFTNVSLCEAGETTELERHAMLPLVLVSISLVLTKIRGNLNFYFKSILNWWAPTRELAAHIQPTSGCASLGSGRS